MMMEAKRNQSLWADACNTAVYLINRSPHSSIGGNHLRIFVHVPRQRRGKWDTKATEGIFIGYSDNVKGYRIMDSKTCEVQVARDVKFF
jgi:hypothetical protein